MNIAKCYIDMIPKYSKDEQRILMKQLVLEGGK